MVFTTRHGGVSSGEFGSLNLGAHVGDDPAAVTENRRRAVATLGLAGNRGVFAEQVHGTHVSVVDDTHAGAGITGPEIAASDALVTDSPGLALAMMVADCVPGVLLDPDAGVLGVFHAGWKGTVHGVAAETVGAMAALGAEPERIVGALGPHITVDRYQVDDVVAGPVRVAFGADTALLVPDGPGHHRFDLAGANLTHLADAGVDPAGIEVVDVGTDDDRFYSHRLRPPVGRFAVIAALSTPGGPRG